MRKCIHCGGRVEPRKTIMANGELAFSLFCPPTWHATVGGNGMRKCPKCGQVSNASAIVETFPEPREWQFYGQPGHRVIRCRGMVNGKYFVHFVVTEKGRAYHRIAYGMTQEVKL